MPFEQIIEKYFVSPLWDKTGYNIVNTAAYAFIALGAIYFVYRQFEKRKFEIGKSFWAGALCWTLFGSSLRVITDSVDSGVFAKTLESSGNLIATFFYPKILEIGIFEYGLLTVSPGIYIVTASLFLLSIFIESKISIRFWAAGVGAFLALLNLAVLFPMMRHLEYGLIVVVAAGIASVSAAYFFKLNKIELRVPVFAHALDGAATWIAIDVFGPAQGVQYFEQHVLSGAIGEITPLGFGLFFLVKTAFAIVAVKLIDGEKEQRLRILALLIVAIMGLAPGIRDILRMVVGT